MLNSSGKFDSNPAANIKDDDMSTLLVLALIVYAGGVYRFWAGFRRTNFSQGKLYLSLLWPVLMFNRSYRQNFNRALKG